MQLLDSLFTIISESLSDVSNAYTIRLNADHFIYAAHFPGEPITPGVCILQTACELAQLAFGRKLSIVKVKNVKFLRIITPGENPVVTYTISKMECDDAEARFQVTVSHEDTVFAKLSLICATVA